MTHRSCFPPLVLVLVLAGCDQPPPAVDASSRIDAAAHDADAHDGSTTDASVDAALAIDGATMDAATSDAGGDDAAALADTGTDAALAVPDAATSGPRVIRVRVLADAACSDLSFDPPSISVPEGTSFTVDWINATGCTEIDIDKNGDVPIVIGLEPGASYHDTVREWCGTLFTGTFYFRAYYAPSFPYYLDVDCSG